MYTATPPNLQPKEDELSTASSSVFLTPTSLSTSDQQIDSSANTSISKISTNEPSSCPYKPLSLPIMQSQQNHPNNSVLTTPSSISTQTASSSSYNTIKSSPGQQVNLQPPTIDPMFISKQQQQQQHQHSQPQQSLLTASGPLHNEINSNHWNQLYANNNTSNYVSYGGTNTPNFYGMIQPPLSSSSPSLISPSSKFAYSQCNSYQQFPAVTQNYPIYATSGVGSSQYGSQASINPYSYYNSAIAPNQSWNI